VSTPRVEQVLSTPDRAAVDALLAEAADADGAPPLSDHLRLDLHAGGASGFVAVLLEGDHGLDAYAQVSAANESSSVELVVRPERRGDYESIATALLGAAVAATAGPVFWWVHGVQEVDERIAAAAGMTSDRRLLQLRRPLPTGIDTDVVTRPFVVGQDEAAWLLVNNRAFAWHPEQGGWDLPTLQAREADDWFDPNGFLLHERDGRLAAFCWTKLHPATTVDPQLGEIYVIAVDPDFTGLGLGKALTLAGLASIADRGVTHGMLFVDEDNTTAVGLYVKLGFETHRIDVAFRSPG
jgi:mycothiol synthase